IRPCMLFLVGWNVNLYHAPRTKMVPGHPLHESRGLPRDKCLILQIIWSHAVEGQRLTAADGLPTGQTQEARRQETLDPAKHPCVWALSAASNMRACCKSTAPGSARCIRA